MVQVMVFFKVNHLNRRRSFPESEVNATDASDKRVPAKKMSKDKEAVTAVKQAKQDSELESKLEKQSKDLWEIKDKLREHVSTAELREVLIVNNQDATGSDYDLRDRWLVHFVPVQ